MPSASARLPLLPLLLGVLFLLQLLFTGLIVLGALVPDGPVLRGIVEHTQPGRSWGLPEQDGVGGQGTPTTDQAVLTSGLGAPGADPWEKAMWMPRLEAGSAGHEQLVRLADGEDLDGELRGYFRYWAGYTVLTRPLLALWGLPGLRLVVAAVLVLAAWGAARALARAASPPHVAAAGLPLLLGSNLVMTPAVSISHALSTATALAGLWLLVEADRLGLRTVLVATVIGAAGYGFVDLLTNPVLPWTLSAALAAGLAYRRTHDVGVILRHGLAVGVVWPLAWALTWMSRWALAILVLGWDTATRDIGGQMQVRMDLGVQSVDATLGAGVVRNVRYWWETVPTAPALLLLGLGALVVLLLPGLRFGKVSLHPFWLLALPALVVPVWYEIFSNHSQIHAAFTYRYVPLTLSLVLLAAVPVREAGRGRDRVAPAGSGRRDA